MFVEFRQNVKNELKARKMNYAQLSEKTGIAESSIKCFMCEANNSRRIAEKIADALGFSLIYSNQKYKIEKR